MKRYLHHFKKQFPFQKAVLLIFVFLLLTLGSITQLFGQTIYTWQGANNASWAVTTNWTPTRSAPAVTDILQFNTGTTLTITALPAGQTIGNFVMSNNTNITLQAAGGITLIIGNGAGTDLNVPVGSALTIGTNVSITLATSATANISGTLTVIAGCTYNTDGTTVVTTVNGTINNAGTITCATAAKLLFQSGSTYAHAQDGGTIPIATWNAASNCNITGITITIPTGFNQTFGNFTWNCAGQTTNLYMQSNITVAGNFSVLVTGTIDTQTHGLRMSNTGTGYTIAVTGNVLIDTNATFKMNNNIGSCTMNVGGDFTINGYFAIVSGGANSTVNVTGNVSIAGGTLAMNENDVVSIGTLNIAGNFTFSGGNINTSNNSWTGTVNFNGNTTHTYSKTGGTITNIINFSVNSPSILDVGTSIIDGSTGTFTLSSGAGIITANTAGLTIAGATGSIQVGGTRTYTTGVNYTYNGTSTQVTGNGLTQNTPANITINNPGNTVTLSAITNMSGILTVKTGSTLALSTFALGATTKPTSLVMETGTSAGASITGTGALNLAGASGVTINTSGTGVIAASITAPITLGAAQTITNNATVVSPSFTIGTGALTNSTYLLTVDGSGNTSISSVIGNGSGGITKTGTGTLTLSGTNTYTGATTVSVGILNIRNAQGTGTTAGGITVASGAALELQGGITVGAETLSLNNNGVGSGGALRNISGDNTWGGTITLLTNAVRINSDLNTLTLNAANSITATNINLTVGGTGNTSISGTITTGSGTLTKDGSGTLTLSGANTYTGATTISIGTLKLGAAERIANTSVVTN